MDGARRSLLLNNTLDALDRLFDAESDVVDICAIVYATACALSGDALLSRFEEAAEGLAILVRSDLPEKEARERALEVTNPLRVALAADLPEV